MFHISPEHSTEELLNASIEQRIETFESQERGWFFEQGRILQRYSSHAGFILLMIGARYIEAHAIFYKGREAASGEHGTFFREAFANIFQPTGTPELNNKAANLLYREVRCGLF